MNLSNRLSTRRAIELLKMKKIFRKAPGQPLYLSVDSGNGRHDIPLISEDGSEEFVLTISRSQKRIAKVSFHHRESYYNYCLFRLDFNGMPHFNPKKPNESVPDELKKFAGNRLDGCHVHYYVEGYGPELSWAVPLRETRFSRFENMNDLESFFQEMVDLVCVEINLIDRILYNKLLF